MTHKRKTRKVRTILASAAIVGVIGGLASVPASALKYAKREHNIHADKRIPMWVPGALVTEPEEEFNVVGADVMDEMTLGWVKLMRKAYPRLSVTMEARASGSGGPALTNGIAHAAPVGRELLPAEAEAFRNKFGYDATPFRVATGSVGSLGKTAASIIMVDKANPVSCLSLQQLDSMYSTTRNRGGPDITTWGQVGATGEWANRPIHKYGLRSPNGIEWYFKIKVMEMGAYKNDIQFVKGIGFSHAFNVAADDMAKKPGGLTYALLANLQPNTKVLALSEKPGGKCVLPTTQSVYDHTYPLSRYVYVYVNHKPGTKLEPKTKEFLRAILSREGQEAAASDGVYLPLQPHVVQEELAKLATM
ncbi:phosphate ABC transporter substrate-binding protein (PhoT family) [Novosphingobium kunmingense]|uniref:Phosphate ABC transporter substrate-binding protein (PhoT family) n=1 Tax=Novosphingobium kunmingense TaxID=1211806 RepID=A0A2N0H3F4_9SPHN|nr:substrate-binding domain-containing protein [Novosphingobium kunmingense]PKB13457.1 phosphate ABC transporter substrate-binding protein (PhoT family) [Novosphingobium kunmingense]